MLESPTGTGKSLSIICSALQWLTDRKEKRNSGLTEESHKVDGNDDEDEPDWMRNFTLNEADGANGDKSIKNTKSPFSLRKHAKEVFTEGEKADELNDQEFLLDEYESQDESSPGGGNSKRKPARGFDSSSSEDEEDENDCSDDEQGGFKVFFCSRTHSQLSQFVKELRKTVFAKKLKVVCLGSRKNLCINEDVLKLGNVTRINERCLDLQKKKISQVSKKKLEDIHCSIESYLGRFQNLLGAGNRRYIQIMLILTRAFLKPLASDRNLSSVNVGLDTENPSKSKPCGACSMAIYDFLFSLNIDNINLVKLLAYIKESNIIHKVSGYGERVAAMLQKDPVAHEEMSKLTSFRAFSDMLVALTNNNGDGRIIISRTSSSTSGQHGGYIKYVMLTGAKLFSEVVDEAHAVILAGGTLQPIEETRERLFPWLPSNQLQFFSCSHIVPPESIMPIAVSHGPSGQSFDFSHSSRSSIGMIQELGLLMSNLVAVVPEGIIVFFSSFEYETQVHTAWSNSGILRRIVKKKRVFREPRKNTEVEAVLRDYKEAIESERGAIMLAVVGGKVSEGINFSDSMCRCVVMVGLPYPSPSDIELLERIKHIEGRADSDSIKPSVTLVDDSYYSGDVQAGFGVLKSCKRRGKEYYENLCMKAVNQSIGRAIRHEKDYASILLVDARYSNDPSKRTSHSHPSNKLPKWIKDRLIYSTKGYGDVHRLLHQFFKHKNVENSSETNQH
ncbi:RAD3-like DNA-binding helicase protein [Arabidopsis thaliana]|nr:RAD3-like DNA-binding helicase protein [Arabidopsis thaliana]ANM58698.1 RAD3-like DNA-binding helicase protein [Arabidopsis thaliana]|eukprot:NP_001321114.1 RAD3-like DNA-binding helicase protein [Arabidopsis thaliana]